MDHESNRWRNKWKIIERKMWMKSVFRGCRRKGKIVRRNIATSLLTQHNYYVVSYRQSSSDCRKDHIIM